MTQLDLALSLAVSSFRTRPQRDSTILPELLLIKIPSSEVRLSSNPWRFLAKQPEDTAASHWACDDVDPRGTRRCCPRLCGDFDGEHYFHGRNTHGRYCFSRWKYQLGKRSARRRRCCPPEDQHPGRRCSFPYGLLCRRRKIWRQHICGSNHQQCQPRFLRWCIPCERCGHCRPVR